ncbi:MAG TPA: APC family permease [Chloroflexota bacterium]|nr:APC family permease [Chloroflexota bacterium]
MSEERSIDRRVSLPDVFPQPQEPEHRPLAENAVGVIDGIVLGIASSAVGASLGGVLAPIAAASGYGAVLALLVGFIPLLGIGVGFYYLNRWRPDVGISYAWVGRLVNPYLGAFIGYLIIAAFVVSNAFAIIPAATTLLTIVKPSLVSNNWAITIVGTLILIIISLIVILGIRIAARFQWILLGFELVVLFVFGTWSLVKALTSPHLHGVATPSLSWFSLSGAGGTSGLVAGLLISMFWYSGWETSVVINEETKRRFSNPGAAGIWALVVIVVLSMYFAICFLSLVPPKAMNANASNWLPLLGDRLAGRPWGNLVALALMSSFIGGIETTIITYGRVSFSMGRDRVFPPAFAGVNPQTRTPVWSMVIWTIPSFIIFILNLWSGAMSNVLGNLSSSIGLMFVFYYAVTGLTATWLLRRIIFRSVRNFITGLVLPAGGALVILWVGAKSLLQLSPATVITAVIVAVVGIVIVLLSRYAGQSPFFTHPESIQTEMANPETSAP